MSAITAWEFITTFHSSKEPGFAGIASDVSSANAAQGFAALPVPLRHSEVASNLPPLHQDPMDRFLIGQAMVEDMSIITVDRNFVSYAARTLW